MKRSTVERKAKELGAKLSKPEYYGSSGAKEVVCEAPEGYWFVEGSATQLIAQYYPNFGESVSDAYKDIYQRLEYGIEEIPKESKYLYGLD